MSDTAGFEESFGDGFEEKYRALVGNIGERMDKIGLYLDFAHVAPANEDGSRVQILTTYVIGDLAWSTKVQDPEQHAMDKQFRTLTTDVEDDQMSELKRKFEAGELPWQKDS